MAKTTNLGLEITTSDSELFEDWRNFINGNNEYSMAKILDTFAGSIVNQMGGYQPLLQAGDNITIDENTNVISASGGGGVGIDLNMLGYMNYAADIFYRARRQNLLASAWEHSLTVDPLEISATSSSSNKRGMAQYPNGATEGVIIPQGVTTIGNYAFHNWTSNNQPLVIPNSITSIGGYVFRNWTSNNQPLVISNSVTNIGNHAFNSWSANNHPLVIPNSVTDIGLGVFQDWTSNNQPLVIPDSVTSIGYYAFRNWTSNNQPLVISNSVTDIGLGVFQDWTSNNQPLVIPDSVTSIRSSAFHNWSANNQPLVIPNSVTNIGDYAFKDWSLVPYVWIQAITPPTLVKANAFDGQNDAPIYVPNESVDDYKAATNWADLASRIFSINDK